MVAPGPISKEALELCMKRTKLMRQRRQYIEAKERIRLRMERMRRRKKK